MLEKLNSQLAFFPVYSWLLKCHWSYSLVLQENMDVIKAELDSDTEINQTSSHSVFNFIQIKQEQEVDSEDEVSILLPHVKIQQ